MPVIVDSLRNANLYFAVDAKIREGLEFLQSASKDITPGTYQLSSSVKVLVTEYDTRVENPGRFEAHRRVIDIQYPLTGLEGIEWSPIAGMKTITEYDEVKDVAFFGEPQQKVKLVLGNTLFGIFFPEDAHNPALAANGVAQRIKKATVKVSIEQT